MLKGISVVLKTIYFKLSWMFFKIGFVSIGGGYAMTSIIYSIAQETVGLTNAEYSELIAVDFMVPGPIAINAATYIGYITGLKNGSMLNGVLASLFATISVALPSYIIVLTVLYFLEKFKKSTILQKFLRGIKAAAVGLIFVTTFLLMQGNLFKEGIDLVSFFKDPLSFIFPISIGIFVAASISLIKFKINPILITFFSGIAGAVLYNLNL